MNRPTMQEIEAYKANARIKFYLAGGSLPVFISRGIVGGIVIVISLLLWWRG